MKKNKNTAFVKFYEKKTKYAESRIGKIIHETDLIVHAIYCKPFENNEPFNILIREIDKEDFVFEPYPKEQVEKILDAALIDFDRRIDSLEFDLFDLKKEKEKIVKLL